MDLAIGEIITRGDPKPDGFCPVGFYVPDWWDVNDGSILTGTPSSRPASRATPRPTPHYPNHSMKSSEGSRGCRAKRPVKVLTAQWEQMGADVRGPESKARMRSRHH